MSTLATRLPAAPPAPASAGPIDLDRADAAWIVESGHLDLFVIEPHEGVEQGRRRPLFSVPAGGVVIGLGGGRDALRFLAIPSLGAEWRPLDREPDAGERDAWVGRLLRAAVPPGPGDLDRTEREGPFALEPGGRAGGGRQARWVRVAEGSLAIGGTVPWGADDPPLLFLDPVWATSDGGAVLQVSAAAPADPLEGVGRFARAAIGARMEAEFAAEIERLERRVAQEADAVSRGLALLAASVGHAGATGARGRAGDPIAAALLPIFERLGLPYAASVIPAPTVEEALARQHVRGRRVLLRPGWDRQSAEPLVGFLGPDQQPVALLPESRGRWRVVGLDIDAPLTRELGDALAVDALQVYRILPPGSRRFRDFMHLGFRGGVPDMLRAGALGLAAAMAGLALPLVMQQVFETLIPEGDRRGLVAMFAVLVVASLAAAAFQIGNGLALLRAQTRFEINASPALMDRLLQLPTRFFRGHSVGDIVDRLLGIQTARLMVGTGFKAMQVSLIVALVSLGLMMSYSVVLGLIAFLLAAAVAATNAVTSRAQLRHVRANVSGRGRLDGFVLQLIVGIAKLRGAAAERRAMAQWAEQFSRRVHEGGEAQWWQAVQRVFDDTLPVLATAGMFAAIGSRQGDAAGLSTGQVIAFATAFGQLLAALLELSRASSQIALATPYVERARPLLEALPEARPDAEPLGRLDGAIGLRNISFRYTENGPLILDDISLDVPAGSFCAFVGPSGSGKSTIFRALLGFESIAAGEILFDGRSSDRIDPAALRRQIGVVLQNGKISSGSILENIIGPAPLGVTEAWAAARMVGLDRDIEEMPMGMQTVLLDGGGTLSGGQRQRLLIARAIVHSPRILLFDEATSALDNRTQAIVTETLRNLAITRIVIAHRLSTIEGADHVFVIEKGRLAQHGGYAELLEKPGPFADLAKRQMVG